MANRLPLLLLSRGRVPEPRARSGAAAGGALGRAVDDGQRRVPGGDALLGPDHPPEQVAQTLPLAVETMLDPADCGPAFVGLPQDVQAEAYDYPARLFEPRVHELRRAAARPPASSTRRRAAPRGAAAAADRRRRRPLLARRGRAPRASSSARAPGRRDGRGQGRACGRPPVLRRAGRRHGMRSREPRSPPTPTSCSRGHAPAGLHHGLVDGVRRADAARRPQRRALRRGEAPRAPARRRRPRGARRAGDALAAGGRRRAGWRGAARGARRSRRSSAATHRRRAADARADVRAGGRRGQPRCATADDYALTAAGGLPGELNVNWLAQGHRHLRLRVRLLVHGLRDRRSVGRAHGRGRRGDVIAFVGDGSYLMLNSELYSSVLTGHKLIVVVCDNGGFAVIDRLQVGKGGAAFNNMLEDVRRGDVTGRLGRARPVARLPGGGGEGSLASSRPRSSGRARAARTTVIAIRTAPHEWTPGGAFWEVGVPEVAASGGGRSGARPTARGQAPPADRLVTSRDPIRVGVVGVGRIGAMHARWSRAPSPGLALAAVHDADAAAAASGWRASSACRPARRAPSSSSTRRSTRSRSARAPTRTSTCSSRPPRRASRSSSRSRSRWISPRSTVAPGGGRGRRLPATRLQPALRPGPSLRARRRRRRERSATSISCGSRAATRSPRCSTTSASPAGSSWT